MKVCNFMICPQCREFNPQKPCLFQQKLSHKNSCICTIAWYIYQKRQARGLDLDSFTASPSLPTHPEPAQLGAYEAYKLITLKRLGKQNTEAMLLKDGRVEELLPNVQKDPRVMGSVR